DYSQGSLTPGPLRGKLPRLYDQCTFVGAASGRSSTTVIMTTYELPFWRPGVQSRVFTKPDPVRGDSGAALLDSENNVVGFAHDLSAMGVPNQHAGWIWAESVFHELDLGWEE